MKYEVIRDGDALTVIPWGSLDVNSSPELESALDSELDDVTTLTVDLAHVTYVSSMGLRLLLSWQKRMFKQGFMYIINVSDDVMELFAATGFTEILEIR
ncbi:MAG: STAS domain-containing protein [Atopobiaceae bacterium]|nr:STAS domain-containing protein [Atopobiaceae bacterium]